MNKEDFNNFQIFSGTGTAVIAEYFDMVSSEITNLGRGE